jgi:hypothetical protein
LLDLVAGGAGHLIHNRAPTPHYAVKKCRFPDIWPSDQHHCREGFMRHWNVHKLT